MPIAVFQIYTFCYDRKMLELIQSSLASSSILQRKRRNHAGSELKYSSCSPTLAALLLTLPECGMECHVLGILDPEHQEVSILPPIFPFKSKRLKS